MTPDFLTTPLAPVSWGELLDKITILEIKSERISDPAARANVRRELDLLQGIAGPALALVAPLVNELRRVNAILWRVEDDIRLKEAAGAFDDHFIALARSVYRTNDERAAIKRRINEQLGSTLVEEKCHPAGVRNAGTAGT